MVIGYIFNIMFDNMYILVLNFINSTNNYILDIFMLMEFLFLFTFFVIFFSFKQLLINTIFLFNVSRKSNFLQNKHIKLS